MASKSERVKVEVKESTNDGVRTFNITLTAPSSDFVLTDLLKQRGVVEALDGELKQAIRAATENYLSAAESLIARLAIEAKPAEKSGTNGKGNGKSGKGERPSSMPQAQQQRESSSGASEAGASAVTA